MVLIDLSGITDGGGCGAGTLTLQVSDYNSMLIDNVVIDYVTGETMATLAISPVGNTSGTSNVTVTVEDSNGGMVSQSFTYTVNSVNDAPVVLMPVADVELKATATLSISLSKVLGTMFDDVDDSTLVYSASFDGGSMPDWISVTDGADELILDVAPMEADTGCYEIIVSAMDMAGATASDTFELCVTKIPVGVNDFGERSFEVNMYPNPTRSLVNIETDATGVNDIEIAVMNIAGQEVYRKQYQAGELLQFNLSKQVSGMYMVLIQMDDKRVVKKLLVDKR